MQANPKTTFNIEFGDFRIQQFTTHTHGSLHRLTPAQFDALCEQFGGDDIRTLTTKPDNYSRKEITFRTAEIDMGGLKLSIFADVA